MGYGYGGGLGVASSANLLGLLTWLIIFIDFVLVGIWLWQQITKK